MAPAALMASLLLAAPARSLSYLRVTGEPRPARGHTIYEDEGMGKDMRISDETFERLVRDDPGDPADALEAARAKLAAASEPSG